MRRTWLIAAVLYAAALPFAYAAAQQETRPYPPPPGSNMVMRSPLAGTPGVEVIVSDVVIPPNGQVARALPPGRRVPLPDRRHGNPCRGRQARPAAEGAATAT